MSPAACAAAIGAIEGRTPLRGLNLHCCNLLEELSSQMIIAPWPERGPFTELSAEPITPEFSSPALLLKSDTDPVPDAGIWPKRVLASVSSLTAFVRATAGERAPEPPGKGSECPVSRVPLMQIPLDCWEHRRLGRHPESLPIVEHR